MEASLAMNHSLLMAGFVATQVLFAFAFGACVGSLINVLVYRMPLGLSVVRPASRCPRCGHVLTWRENIPVFGWLLLRGRCRFCKIPISAEYPIVEAIVGLLFVVFYVLWYVVPMRGGEWAGVDWSLVRPEWALNGFTQTWPVFITLLVLVGSLVAMTLIDARTFTIPLILTWIPAAVAAVAHPAWAGYLQAVGKRWRHHAPDEWWAMATPGAQGWPILCAAFGGVAGLLIANALLGLGLIRRSFEDYDAWEAEARREAGLPPLQQDEHAGDASAAEPAESREVPEVDTVTPATRARRRRLIGVGAVFLGAGILVGVLALLPAGAAPVWGGLVGLLLAVPLLGVVARGMRLSAPVSEAADDSPAEMWIQYPRARREVLREAVFLAPAAALIVAGWYLGVRLGEPWSVNPIDLSLTPSRTIPMWLSVLGGVALGYLAGGGIVWGIRILGTLGFGKEAMGLGDVHLLAAVGACVGWLDAVLAFFLAPFMAIYIVLVQACWTGGGRRAMPYGPYLAAATLVVLLAKPAIELGLTAVFGSPVPLDFP